MPNLKGRFKCFHSPKEYTYQLISTKYLAIHVKMSRRLSSKEKLKSLLTVTSTTATLFGGLCIYQSNEKFYSGIAVPLVQLLDPETAHTAAVKILKWGLLPRQNLQDPPSLAVSLWDLRFKNPVGMAAGFDKQGEAVEGLHKLGFSFVEIGNYTRIIRY